jgi:hypothetical protein
MKHTDTYVDHLQGRAIFIIKIFVISTHAYLPVICESMTYRSVDDYSRGIYA